ncbi:MAG: hypothetical protein ABII00_15520 [Elusimicrobiota bacterium]
MNLLRALILVAACLSGLWATEAEAGASFTLAQVVFPDEFPPTVIDETPPAGTPEPGLATPPAGTPAPVVATPPVVSTTPLGVELPMDRGPWVVGEAVFVGNQSVSDYALRGNIRARRGTLYTPSDIESDVAELTAMPAIISAKAALYSIPDQPVPGSYRTIAVSTMMVRIVYTVEEKAMFLPGLRPRRPRRG